MSLSLIREIYLTLADIKFRLDAEGDTEANRTLHAFFQVYGEKMRDALGVETFREVQLWKPDSSEPVIRAKTVISNAYQAVGVLATGPERPSEKDVINLLDMLSRWEDWSTERIENFLPWPKEWAATPEIKQYYNLMLRIIHLRGAIEKIGLFHSDMDIPKECKEILDDDEKRGVK